MKLELKNKLELTSIIERLERKYFNNQLRFYKNDVSKNYNNMLDFAEAKRLITN